MSHSSHKWTPVEDASLVSCMVELHSQGHLNAETGFKISFLPDLEKLLLQKVRLKANPHIESRLKTFKSLWMIVYDIIHGKHTSRFWWDDSKHCVVAEDEVWNVYVQVSSHNSFVV